MSHFSRTVARLCAGLAIVASLGVAAPVKASVIQLGFIIDESGSIGSGNYTIIKNGLASAINTLIPVDGTYEISVVSFASSAQTLVNHVLIDSAAALTSVVNSITGDGYSGGSTYMGAAFNAMTNALSGSTRAISASYVNFATDGVNSDADATVIAARNALIAAGADNISVEGIGSGIDQNFLKNSICFPGPCDDSAPYNFPTQGFYIGVADAAGYAAAIGNKIRIVTGQVPEPQMIALLGVGLLALVPAMRRRVRRQPRWRAQPQRPAGTTAAPLGCRPDFRRASPRPYLSCRPCESNTCTVTGMPAATLCVTVQNCSNCPSTRSRCSSVLPGTPSVRRARIASTRSRFSALRPTSAVTSAASGSGFCLNLRSANSSELDRQLPTAEASSWIGDGPAPWPSGGGSSPTRTGTSAPNATSNW